jgi:predicted deacylase
MICTVDLDRAGRQVGFIEVPRSTNTSGWSHLYIPLVCVANGDGPTALVLGGNHGDEYEGQVAAMKLAQTLRPHDVTGRIVVIPCLSLPASKAFTRLWPSGENFNRLFPGSAEGSPAEQLAWFLTDTLFPLSDVVIDMHSGGRTTMFLPCSHMHVVDDPAQRRAMLEGMLAWNSDWHYLYIDVAGSGLLPVEAENQGKNVITTELGGGGHVTAAVHRLAETGLANVLRHVGALRGEPAPPRNGTILDGRDPANYVFAPESGLFETLVHLGDEVEAGQMVGRIHFLERIDRDPVPIPAPLGGVVAGVRAIATTEQGDSVVVIGQPVERDVLL